MKPSSYQEGSGSLQEVIGVNLRSPLNLRSQTRMTVLFRLFPSVVSKQTLKEMLKGKESGISFPPLLLDFSLSVCGH